MKNKKENKYYKLFKSFNQKKYQYQTLRYMPDRVSGEFINLGIAILDMESLQLHFRFHKSGERLQNFFPSVNSLFVMDCISKSEQGMAMLKKEYESLSVELLPANIEATTSKLLPKDDSALYFTEPKISLEYSGEAMADELFTRMVCSHLPVEGVKV